MQIQNPNTYFTTRKKLFWYGGWSSSRRLIPISAADAALMDILLACYHFGDKMKVENIICMFLFFSGYSRKMIKNSEGILFGQFFLLNMLKAS